MQSHFRTALCLFALIAFTYGLHRLWVFYGPERLTSNGLSIEAESDTTGIIQVFFNFGEGFDETTSTFRPIKAGVRERFYFPVTNRSLTKIRLDPIDQPAARVVVENAFLTGPMGWRWRDLDLSTHSAANRLEIHQATPSRLELTSTSDDPVILLKTDPSVLPAPFFAAWIPRLLTFVVLWALAAWVLSLFLLRHLWSSSWQTCLVAIYGFGALLFVLQFYVVPRQTVNFGWFYGWVALAGLTSAALYYLKDPGLIRNLLHEKAFWFFAAFLLYFALRIAPMQHEEAPPKADLFRAYAVLLILPFTLAPVFRVINPEEAWNTVRFYGLVAASVAILTLVPYYDQSSIDPDDIFPFGRILGWNGVHKEIVGSAAYCGALFGLILVQSRPQKLVWQILIYVALAFLFVYIQQCQSRGVVGASLIASGVLFCLTKRRKLQVLLGILATATLLYHLTPIPMYLAGFDEKPDRLKLETYVDVTRIPEVAPGKSSIEELTREEIHALVPIATVREVQDKSGNRMVNSPSKRPHIWKAYIAEGLKHPVFGNGFNKSHTLSVSGGEDFPIGPISSHSVYVSSFYYGGFIGLALFAAMMWAPILSVFRGLRNDYAQAELYALATTIIAALLLAIEAVIIAENKVNVLCWNPNGYWIAVWMVLILVIAWKAANQSARPATTT